jgi:hypothetical protein
LLCCLVGHGRENTFISFSQVAVALHSSACPVRWSLSSCNAVHVLPLSPAHSTAQRRTLCRQRLVVCLTESLLFSLLLGNMHACPGLFSGLCYGNHAQITNGKRTTAYLIINNSSPSPTSVSSPLLFSSFGHPRASSLRLILSSRLFFREHDLFLDPLLLLRSLPLTAVSRRPVRSVIL